MQEGENSPRSDDAAAAAAGAAAGVAGAAAGGDHAGDEDAEDEAGDADDRCLSPSGDVVLTSNRKRGREDAARRSPELDTALIMQTLSGSDHSGGENEDEDEDEGCGGRRRSSRRSSSSSSSGSSRGLLAGGNTEEGRVLRRRGGRRRAPIIIPESSQSNQGSWSLAAAAGAVGAMEGGCETGAAGSVEKSVGTTASASGPPRLRRKLSKGKTNGASMTQDLDQEGVGEGIGKRDVAAAVLSLALAGPTTDPAPTKPVAKPSEPSKIMSPRSQLLRRKQLRAVSQEEEEEEDEGEEEEERAGSSKQQKQQQMQAQRQAQQKAQRQAQQQAQLYPRSQLSAQDRIIVERIQRKDDEIRKLEAEMEASRQFHEQMQTQYQALVRSLAEQYRKESVGGAGSPAASPEAAAIQMLTGVM